MEKVETKAVLRRLRMSPQKVRLLVDLIRGMSAAEAALQLQFSKKAAAKPVLKLLQSAIANAKHNSNAKEDSLVVKTAFVDGGPTLHRWKPRAMGRATPIRKRTSHITLILEGEAEKKSKAEEVEKKEENKEEKTEKSEKTNTKKTEVKKETKEVKKKATKKVTKSKKEVKKSK